MKNYDVGNRIIIIGCPGSGKSRLSELLQKRTGLPLFHLDALWWKEDRTHVSRAAFDDALQAILQGEKWIVDGDYSRTHEVRFSACDTVIFLDFPEEICMKGIAERIGQKRDDLPWVEHELDPELVELVQTYPEKNRPEVCSLIERYPEKKVLIFHTREEVDAWIS